ncbi:hypothetical protein P7K49_005831 [Saguinus oedipus]|uniref:Uncharacterized protein n=1 Tax=Saguinus oedipus TaxID=9490 RepID=A0ABQ9W0N5_SAGOE|nr:hypothetical protein P7K49_005831 [Saguinus oedipus]
MSVSGLEVTPEKDPAARGLRMRMRRDEEASDPTSAAAQLRRFQGHLPQPSSARTSVVALKPRPSGRKPLLTVLLEPEEAQKLAAERARAPVVPYGVDLHYWGQELPTAGKILKDTGGPPLLSRLVEPRRAFLSLSTAVSGHPWSLGVILQEQPGEKPLPQRRPQGPRCVPRFTTTQLLRLDFLPHQGCLQ